MCGIAGILNINGLAVERQILKKMTDAVIHRGPESEGDWIEDNLGLGHRRLAIIDLSESGHQPMHYLDRYVIVFNGEIYNYIEIKDILIKKGYVFSTGSDTEVIMAAYDCWGKDCLGYFDGMFAFGLFDKQKKQLFCARDRFGEKPFHYYLDNQKFMFGSEMKSLWAAGVEKKHDDYSMYLFLNMGLHEDPRDKSKTFFKNIFRLKPAHYFIFDGSGPIEQKPYWSIEKNRPTQNISFEDACLRFKELFEQSVSRRLRSDVPVGTSLSGGLDSSAVALVMYGLLKENSTQKCFSARFDDPNLDEGFFMEKVIRGRNIDHIVTWPDSEKMINELPKIIWHQEEPFASASIYAQWEVFKLALENNVTVLLDGQGADEVFAGYTHFFAPYLRGTYLKEGKKGLDKKIALCKENNLINDEIQINRRFFLEAKRPNVVKTLQSARRKISGFSAVPEINPELHRAYCHKPSPFDIFNDLNENLRYFTLVSGLDKLLRFADRNSMAHSREVRLPFLSHELVEFAFSMPSDYKINEGWTKALVRFGLKDILPEEIAFRKNKLGFQPPQKAWEKTKEFSNFMADYNRIAIDKKYINPKAPATWKGMMTGLFLNM